MSKTKLIYLPIGILTIVTATAAAVLTAVGVSAESSTKTATVQVGDSCTLAASGQANHTLSLAGGTVTTTTGANANAPTTILTATCNDNSGYDLYAVGYYNNAVSTVLYKDASNSIATGTSTGGTTSSWAFKLEQSGTGAPTIASGYGAWAAVPGSQTKVASYSTNTNSSAVKVSYQIYVAYAQAAGTYSGGVKYTIVHPAGTTAPSA